MRGVGWGGGMCLQVLSASPTLDPFVACAAPKHAKRASGAVVQGADSALVCVCMCRLNMLAARLSIVEDLLLQKSRSSSDVVDEEEDEI